MLGTLAGLQCREYAAQFVAKVSSAGYPEAGTQEAVLESQFLNSREFHPICSSDLSGIIGFLFPRHVVWV